MVTKGQPLESIWIGPADERRNVGTRSICESCAHPMSAASRAGLAAAYLDHTTWMGSLRKMVEGAKLAPNQELRIGAVIVPARPGFRIFIESVSPLAYHYEPIEAAE